jgi:uncharacterized damage-inducible protein DinB
MTPGVVVPEQLVEVDVVLVVKQVPDPLLRQSVLPQPDVYEWDVELQDVVPDEALALGPRLAEELTVPQPACFYSLQRRLFSMFDVKELWQYSSSVRRRFLEKLESLPWDEVTRNREASFYSMKDILLHIIDNEDMIVNWQVLGRGAEYKRARDWGEYSNMQMIRNHLDEVEKKTRAYLERADEQELGRRVNFTIRSGTFDLSVEECLLQSFTEQLYHMGELIALLWQEDIEPPRMQWFWNNPRVRA